MARFPGEIGRARASWSPGGSVSGERRRRSPRALPDSCLEAGSDGMGQVSIRIDRGSGMLVPRTRSSHYNCGESDCELRVQSGTRIIGLLVSFDSEVRYARAAYSGELRNRDTSARGAPMWGRIRPSFFAALLRGLPKVRT